MSYILDALRKSDQLRRRGAAPTLLLGQATAATPKRSAPLAYGLLALVLLGAGMAIGWLHPWQKQPPAPSPRAAAVKPPAASRSQTAPAASAAALIPQPQAQARSPAPAAPRAAEPARVSVPPVRAPEETKTKRKSVPPKAVATPPAAGSAAISAAPPMAAADLPLAIQQELPPLSVSVHAYSVNPADRLVDINGRLLHEGDNVAPGLRLERITPEGMILNYKGYTFLRGVR